MDRHWTMEMESLEGIGKHITGMCSLNSPVFIRLVDKNHPVIIHVLNVFPNVPSPISFFCAHKNSWKQLKFVQFQTKTLPFHVKSLTEESAGRQTQPGGKTLTFIIFILSTRINDPGGSKKTLSMGPVRGGGQRDLGPSLWGH